MVDNVQSGEVYAPWREFSKVDENQRLKGVDLHPELSR